VKRPFVLFPIGSQVVLRHQKQKPRSFIISRTDHETYCPYKGDCAYFSIPAGGARSMNAVWTYEAPYEAVASIKDHLAALPDAPRVV
jgi:uncharacterized protein (DUF427 family)